MNTLVQRPRLSLMLLLLLLPALSPLAAGDQESRPARPDPTPQRQAMQKLDYMEGTWRGEGWIDIGGQRLTFRGSETVQWKLGGLVLLVEGDFYGLPPGAKEEVPVHTTLGVISYDPAAQSYPFRTWLATGSSGSRDLVLAERGWSWEIGGPQEPRRVRYKMEITPAGEWLEVGERTGDGATWTQFFEMKLRKAP